MLDTGQWRAEVAWFQRGEVSGESQRRGGRRGVHCHVALMTAVADLYRQGLCNAVSRWKRDGENRNKAQKAVQHETAPALPAVNRSQEYEIGPISAGALF